MVELLSSSVLAECRKCEQLEPHDLTIFRRRKQCARLLGREQEADDLLLLAVGAEKA